MRVEITLKSGVTITAYADDFTITRDKIFNVPNGFEWITVFKQGVPALKYVRVESVDAVVVYPESTDGQRRKDERDAETAKPGGDQVDPG